MRKSAFTVLVLVVFALTSTLASAASKWVVIQTKDGVYKVIKSKGVTPRTVDGPFRKKKDAVAARDRLKFGNRGGGHNVYTGGNSKPKR